MESARCKPILSGTFRSKVLHHDVAQVREIVQSTGFFTPDEVRMAGDLVRERLARGPDCGYHFLFAESGDEVLGYACFGPIDCTDNRYDLYWIAVRADRQGMGLGKELLAACEQRMRFTGGRKIYVETSSQERYAPTRAFYEKLGYGLEATVRDFYKDGDHKLIYVKDLPPESGGR